MTQRFGKRLKNVGNDVYMSKMASVFEKRLRYVGMTQICGKQLKYVVFDKRLN